MRTNPLRWTDLAEELPDWVFRLWASGNEWNTQELVMARMEVSGRLAADRRVPDHGSSERIAATSSIDLRSGLGQGSVQVSGVVARIAAVHVRRVTLIWRALPRTPAGRERLKKGMLCW